jgi:hypothetical protein
MKISTVLSGKFFSEMFIVGDGLLLKTTVLMRFIDRENKSQALSSLLISKCNVSPL